MLLAGIVHGLRTPDETAVEELNEAIRRLLIDGVRKDCSPATLRRLGVPIPAG